MRTRIYQKYSPMCGTWWEVWVKILCFWVKSPLIFRSYEDAYRAQFYEPDELFDEPVKTLDIR